MYDPHDGPPHGGGALTTCHFCHDYADDVTLRTLGHRGRRWYVSARYGRLSRLLAGPFADAASAIAAHRSVVDRVYADYARDPRATFAGFGIASSLADLPTLYGTGDRDDSLDPLAIGAA